MGYNYFVTKMFHHFNIPMGVGKTGRPKQLFTLNTLEKCECIEEKGNPLSKVSQLIKEQDKLKHELVAMVVLVINMEAEIAQSANKGTL